MYLINLHLLGKLLFLNRQFLLSYNLTFKYSHYLYIVRSKKVNKNMKKHLLFLSILFSFHAISYSAERDFFLSSPEEHSEFIRKALTTAQKSVVIVSPFISEHRLKDTSYNNFDGLSGYMQKALNKGVKIYVYTDKKLDEGKSYAENGRNLLHSLGVSLKMVDRIHTKNIFIDNDCSTVGSFNWLSAETNSTSDFCRFETTSIHYDDQAKHIRTTIMGELINLEIKEIPISRCLTLSNIDKHIVCITRLNQECSTKQAKSALKKLLTDMDPNKCIHILEILYSYEPQPTKLVCYMADHLITLSDGANATSIARFIEALSDSGQISRGISLIEKLYVMGYQTKLDMMKRSNTQELLRNVLYLLDEKELWNVIEDLHSREDKPKELLIYLINHLTRMFDIGALKVAECIEILIELKEKTRAEELIKSLLSCDRSNKYDNYDNFDYIYSCLDGIGLPEIAVQFETYMHTGKKSKKRLETELKQCFEKLNIT
ncbi:MAG: hypothetical protein C0425_11070 [Chlorobiaceae bacterium]|nr:hypothetical protein [Chlorobiaceae bacterium]